MRFIVNHVHCVAILFCDAVHSGHNFKIIMFDELFGYDVWPERRGAITAFTPEPVYTGEHSIGRSATGAASSAHIVDDTIAEHVIVRIFQG